MTTLTILETPISTFENLYSLNDLHKASGNDAKHKPANYLRLEQTKDLICELDKEQFSDMRSTLKVINGGRNRGTYVCEELMLSYAMWISPKFHLTVLRTFLDLYRVPKINASQKRTLINLVDQRVKRTGETHQAVWKKSNTAFGINSYHELPTHQFDDYVEFVTGMKAIPQQMPTNQLDNYDKKALVWTWFALHQCLDFLDDIVIPLEKLGSRYDARSLATEYKNTLNLSHRVINKLTQDYEDDWGMALPMLRNHKPTGLGAIAR
ncbi:KilA-N domain-containing protein [Phocoenobacter skyensis]|uniref:P22AR C-terminal domain-containing protein n=1 Tax=Phocoenobacter skyensis TaxID=97481 RepID=A0A1H7XMA3_9PAST|nr:KilA-N domain-containing protein [Pasteurella skyensis]MDP8184357.1 KilA-N domain-containing protein [Pasteurella skyensis]QLB22635.1 hypothetical protein A6B44_05205 [Pasteurella skyensis]SEM34805.1 P22AR C-terminal domain-containing protein [Pasteurella skyensis]